MPSLIIHTNDGDETVPLTRRITSLGRSASNDVRLDADGVDETHAMLQLRGEAFDVQNLSATEQVLVNDKPVRRSALHDGDRLQIGTCHLTFQLFDRTSRRPSGNEMARRNSYEQIVNFARRLLASSDMSTLLRELIDAVIELTEADRGFLILIDDEGDASVAIARNVAQEEISDANGNFSDSILRKVIDTRRPLIVSDALGDDQFKTSQSVVNLKLCSVICVPLLVESDLIGVIYAGNNNVVNLFDQAHLDAVSVFAGFASLALRARQTTDGLVNETQTLRTELERLRFGSIIGACEAMQGVYRRVEKVAPTNIPVLVRGETGTGKELIARELHQRSNRSDGPFVAVNCGAIPPGLLESELFGHVRGAFTGATTDRRGVFEAAQRGTLFLDELGELPTELQVKLLRALQEGEISPVGSSHTRSVDVRVVSATNADLAEAIRDGSFRDDLYYRLNVVEIVLPPLRDRGDDVVLLAEYFLKRAAEEPGISAKKLSKMALQTLRTAPLPGNIRQLENVIKKALILSSGDKIEPEDLGIAGAPAESAIQPLADARQAWQREYVERALQVSDGNRTQAAGLLGIDPRTLYRYLED